MLLARIFTVLAEAFARGAVAGAEQLVLEAEQSAARLGSAVAAHVTRDLGLTGDMATATTQLALPASGVYSPTVPGWAFLSGLCMTHRVIRARWDA